MKSFGATLTGLRAIGLVLLLLLSGCSQSVQPKPSGLPLTASATAAPAEMSRASETSASTAVTQTPDLAPSAAPTATRSPSATPSATPTVTASPAPTATPTLGPTPDGVARELRVPILMYHHVAAPPQDADIYRRDNSVTPERFESHLQYLRTAGYETITLDDLLYALAQGLALPDKPVILTFDDGYEDNYLNAFPLLQKYGMIGHFFIMTDVINDGTPDYLSWSQIEEMSAAGQRFGSHARYHIPDQRGRSTDYLVWHALGAMEAIQEHLGYHPRWIAYPSGAYDAQTIAVYQSAHYWGGLSIRQGATHTLSDIFEWTRVRIRSSYTVDDLAMLLALDW